MLPRLDLLGDAEFAKLKESLAPKKLMVLVHPFFSGGNSNLEKFLAHKANENYVFFFLEGKENLASLASAVEKNTHLLDRAYWLPAFSVHDPTPLMRWSNFFKLLNRLGIKDKHVIVGGMKFFEGNQRELGEMKWQEGRNLRRRAIRKLTPEDVSQGARNYSSSYSSLKAMQKGFGGPHAGCAGVTAAKLGLGGFKTTLTRRFG